MTPPDRALIERLRTLIARGEEPRPAGPAIPLAPAIDAGLPGGGLARGAVHELLTADPGAAAALAALILARAGTPTVWIEPNPDPYPAGLAGFGLDPAALIVVRADGADALWAAEESLRAPAVAGVLATLPRLDFATGRRLHLAAEAGGTLGLILRPDTPNPPPSAARTRWRITALPAPGQAHLVGPPHWRLELVRARGAPPGTWDVAWDGTLAVLDKARAHG
ncbi:ImuA family protein [Elioraea sp.]|uniref:ImuA family protein n=1 Tax=Elioraea sp. TaxID=2185103 RepID=UPI003F6FDB7C